MTPFTTYTGELAWHRLSHHMANKTHKCNYSGCPYNGVIDSDTEYIRHTTILEGNGIYTEKYHVLCEAWEFER